MSFAALWIYQAERFPLKKTAPLLAVFSAASLCVSAVLAGRGLPDVSSFLSGFLIAMLIFFQMRVCDEYKDLEDDQRYRPERPIPRGLVSLKLIVGLGVLSVPVAAWVAWMSHPPVLGLLALVWLWLAAMTFEFGVPEWLKARPVLYLLSHMAILPLIDLMLTGLEWVRHDGAAAGLWMFLALSFVNGCVLEIGRKLWATESEIEGVDSYSRLWGPQAAAFVWSEAVALSLALLLVLGAVTGALWICAVFGGLGAAVCWVSAWKYAHGPTLKAEKTMDMLAGLWVFACYVLAGFAPVVLRMM